MNLTPVSGSPTAATSGDSLRRSVSRSAVSFSCHFGRANSCDTPPLVPCDSGESNHAYSASHSPRGPVDRVVAPTAVIAGSDEMASSPTSFGPGGDDHSSAPLHSKLALSPVASNADVPCFCAVANADSTGARSVALTNESHDHPIDRLHTAPGNWLSASENIVPIFSYAPSATKVGRALTTTRCASGSMACAPSRSIVVSP